MQLILCIAIAQAGIEIVRAVVIDVPSKRFADIPARLGVYFMYRVLWNLNVRIEFQGARSGGVGCF